MISGIYYYEFTTLAVVSEDLYLKDPGLLSIHVGSLDLCDKPFIIMVLQHSKHSVLKAALKEC